MNKCYERIKQLKSAAENIKECDIHCYSLNDTNIVIDVNSGAVHLPDLFSYYVIRKIIQKPLEIIIPELQEEFQIENFDMVLEEVLNELEKLVFESQIFSINPYKTPSFIQKVTNLSIKAMCLHIAHDCNMSCEYCFAGEGSFGGDRKLLDIHTAYAAVDFLLRYSGEKKNLEIDFFGGEPLLNFEVVKKTVEYADKMGKMNDRRFRFTLTTNGVLLNEDIGRFLNEHFDNVVLSLDGRKEINDRMRHMPDGSGSYDIIVSRIKDFIISRLGSSHPKYYVRGTYTAYNKDFYNDVVHLLDCGFDKLSLEPVSVPDGTGYEIKEEHLPILLKEYEKLASEYISIKNSRNSFEFFHFNIDLDNGPCTIKRTKGCGAGFEYVAVTPDGGIYPCHQFAGMKEYEMGNVNGISGDYLQPLTHHGKDLIGKMSGNNIFTLKKCSKCWARYFCGGGCAACKEKSVKKTDGINDMNDINDIKGINNSMSSYEINCELLKKRVECAIWIKAMEKNNLNMQNVD